MRVLIVGVGSIGERHLRCFGRTSRVDVSICEPNPTLRDRVAEQYKVTEAFPSLELALENSFDAAVVCTPAHTHLTLATQLLASGAHVLVEKPLSTTLDDIAQFRASLAGQTRTVGVAYVSRLHPLLAAMRQAIREGRFGRPVQLVAVSGQHFPYYRPAYREIYYRDRSTGGGAIQDALTHLVNSGEWLVGPMTEVTADADHQVLEGVTVEDTVHVIARHGQVQASYSLNQHQAPNETTLTVICERGTVRFEPQENRWRWSTTPEEGWHDEVGEPLERDDLFVWHAEMFLNAIEHGTPVACTLDEGEQTLKACLAILRAAETRTWVAI